MSLADEDAKEATCTRPWLVISSLHSDHIAISNRCLQSVDAISSDALKELMKRVAQWKIAMGPHLFTAVGTRQADR